MREPGVEVRICLEQPRSQEQLGTQPLVEVRPTDSPERKVNQGQRLNNRLLPSLCSLSKLRRPRTPFVT